MANYVFDLEANGFLDVADTIWCGVFKDVLTGDVIKVYGGTCYNGIHNVLSTADSLIGHNIIDYDIPLMKKILGVNISNILLFDTYLMSQMVENNRKKHPDCPKDKGPHSLANFGCMFGRYKPEHEEWDRFSPKMLHRCAEDVEINYLVWKKLAKEMGLECHLKAIEE